MPVTIKRIKMIAILGFATGLCLISMFGAAVENTNSGVVKPDNVAHWTKADTKAFPNCQSEEIKGNVPVTVILVDNQNKRFALPFDKAWELTHKDKWPDPWVIGFCY